MENKMTVYELAKEALNDTIAKLGSKQAMLNYYFEYKDNKLFWRETKHKHNRGDEVTIYKNCTLKLEGVPFPAGRVIYEMHFGDIPKGLRVGRTDQCTENIKLSNLFLESMTLRNLRAKKLSNNTSGFKGVFWAVCCKNWEVRVAKDRKRIRMGGFDDPRRAGLAYLEISTNLINLTMEEIKEIVKKHKQLELAA
jgi:hypothetical protein